jgi:ABC-type glutathione transport system ATPase component
MEAVAIPVPAVLDVPHRGPALSADNLTRRYGTGDTAVDALRGVSLDVPKGQLTAVMGPSAPANRP